MTMSSRRRSSDATAGGVVCVSHCCGTTCPSGPMASRAMRTQACSTILAPARERPRAWACHGMVPQRIHESTDGHIQVRRHRMPSKVLLSGKARTHLRNAICMVSSASTWASAEGMAVSQAPACGPASDRSSVREARQQHAVAKVRGARPRCVVPPLGAGPLIHPNPRSGKVFIWWLSSSLFPYVVEGFF